MALTLAQMLRKTPAYVQKGSRNTKVLSAKMVLTTKGRFKKLKATVLRVSNDNVKHNRQNTEIMALTSGPEVKLSESTVKVSCTCEAFTYWGIEYVLHKHGAADIIHSNGKSPDLRNPAQVIYLCPHLAKMALLVLYKDL